MMWQLGWTTLPGLRGLSVSEFRATPTATPDNQGGVAMEFTDETERREFLARLEAEFAQRRFSNAAEAFDSVRNFVLEQTLKRNV
jgi:hypothetical protein